MFVENSRENRRQLKEDNSLQSEKIVDIKSDNMDNGAIFKEVKTLLHHQHLNRGKQQSL